MNRKELIKNSIIAQDRKAQAAKPLMDIAAARKELLEWLAPLRLPAGVEAVSWEDLIQQIPTHPEEEKESTGLRVRLALRLCTREHRYLISIMECLDPDSRDVYTVSTHVDWKSDERQMQKLVDEGYRGQFDDLLRARHTLWAQTFREKQLGSALNCCATAILANEMVAEPDQKLKAEAVPRLQSSSPRFPKPIDE